MSTQKCTNVSEAVNRSLEGLFDRLRIYMDAVADPLGLSDTCGVIVACEDRYCSASRAKSLRAEAILSVLWSVWRYYPDLKRDEACTRKSQGAENSTDNEEERKGRIVMHALDNPEELSMICDVILDVGDCDCSECQATLLRAEAIRDILLAFARYCPDLDG
jgi:hypothetical protein